MGFGTLAFDTLQHSTSGLVDTKYAVSGTIKVFYISVTTFGTADNSFGLSSSSDTATGKTTLNFTNAFDSVHYAVAGVSFDFDGDFVTQSKTTSSVLLTHQGGWNAGGSKADADANLENMITGDLA